MTGGRSLFLLYVHTRTEKFDDARAIIIYFAFFFFFLVVIRESTSVGGGGVVDREKRGGRSQVLRILAAGHMRFRFLHACRPICLQRLTHAASEEAQ